MGDKENKELAERFNEMVFNQHSIDAADAMLHDDFIEHQVVPGFGNDRKDTLSFFEQWFAAMPAIRSRIDQLIASGDRVAIRSTFGATQTGEFLGMPATGKSFEIGTQDIVRVKDGKFIEHWGVQDTVGMMMQLGLMPTPEGGRPGDMA